MKNLRSLCLEGRCVSNNERKVRLKPDEVLLASARIMVNLESFINDESDGKVKDCFNIVEYQDDCLMVCFLTNSNLWEYYE